MIKKLLAGIVYLVCSVSLLSARQNEDILDYTVVLSPGEYSLEQIIEVLNNTNIVSVTYNANVIPLNALVKTTSSTPSIRQILKDPKCTAG